MLLVGWIIFSPEEEEELEKRGEGATDCHAHIVPTIYEGQRTDSSSNMGARQGKLWVENMRMHLLGSGARTKNGEPPWCLLIRRQVLARHKLIISIGSFSALSSMY